VRFVVAVPDFEELADLFDVDSGAWHLPESSMGRLAASARISLVACLLEELAAEASSELPDFMGLLALLWAERAFAFAHALPSSGHNHMGRGDLSH